MELELLTGKGAALTIVGWPVGGGVREYSLVLEGYHCDASVTLTPDTARELAGKLLKWADNPEGAVAVSTCQVCGQPLSIGDFPCITTPRRHGKVQPRGGFEPRFMESLGAYVTGWGDVRKAMRQNNLDWREYPSKGEKSARLDRIAERKKVERAEDEPYFMVPPPSSVTVDGPRITIYDARERPVRRQIGFSA